MIAKVTNTAPAQALLALRNPLLRALQDRKPLLTALLFAALTSCSILPEREPNTIYEPARPSAPAVSQGPRVNWSLVLPRPIANLMLDSESILVRPAAGSLQVYKGAQWSDAAPNVFQTALLRHFEDSGKILAVARPGGGVGGDYQLQTELRTFESIYAQPGQPSAVIEIYAKLVHNATGRVVAARSFAQREPAASESVAAVVDAFSTALNRINAEVAAWTLVSGNQHHGGLAPPAG